MSVSLVSKDEEELRCALRVRVSVNANPTLSRAYGIPTVLRTTMNGSRILRYYLPAIPTYWIATSTTAPGGII